jgi:hypothetical protein
VRALQELKSADQVVRDELLEIIHSEARRLESTSLDSRDELHEEERDLRPQPEIGSDASGAHRE